MQRRRIQTAGQRSSTRRNGQVVRPGQPGDAVQQDHHVPLVLYQTLSTLDHHLRHPFVVLRQLIKGGIDDFHIISLDGFFDIRYFLRPLIDEQDHQMHLRAVCQDRFCLLYTSRCV